MTASSFTWMILLFQTLHQPITSPRTCYFCADFRNNCELNAKSKNLTRMTCHGFLVNKDKPVYEYFKAPDFMKRKDIESLYSPSLTKMSTKSVCMTLNYFYVNTSQFSIYDKDLEKKIWESPTKRRATFQSCMWEKVFDYANVCDYVIDKLQIIQFVAEREHLDFTNPGDKYFDPNTMTFRKEDCMMCKNHDCNSANMTVFELTIFSTILIFVYIFIYNSFS